MTRDNVRVAIIGAGAIGSYYGARLAQAGVDVTFLLRGDYDKVRQNGIRVKSVDGNFTLPKIQHVKNSKEIGKVDLVIIAWKTTSNEQYKKVIHPLLHNDTLILTLQNGLGNCEKLASLFGAHRVLGGLCFICVNRLSPGEIYHSASGQIRIGEFEPDGTKRLNRLVDFLSLGGIRSHSVENLEHAQWMKLIWNIPFNGLAISEGGVDTEILLSTSGMEERIRNIMREVAQVAEAMGHEIKESFIDQQVKVTRTMDAYRPSSMIDFVEGKEVEVDSIWREPLRRAKSLGVKIPETEKLLKEITVQIMLRNEN